MEYLALLLIPLFAALRVTDGGWHRLPGSNVILWMTPAVVIGLVTLNPWISSAGLVLGRQWTQGYEDWNNYVSQLIRSYPAGVFVLLCVVAHYFGVYDPNWLGINIGFAAVVLSNTIQPLLRDFIAARTELDSHLPNRISEGLEGAALGLLVVAACI